MWEKGLALRKKKDISADEFISAAEGLVDSFSASVFTGKSNGDPYWTDSGTAMLSAMIMQLLVDTHECEDIQYACPSSGCSLSGTGAEDLFQAGKHVFCVKKLRISVHAVCDKRRYLPGYAVQAASAA